ADDARGRKSDSPSGNDCTVHATRDGSKRHLTRPWVGYAFRALAIRQVLRASSLWTFGVYGDVAVDRSRPPVVDHSPDESDLARLLESGDQASAAPRP